MLPVSHRLPIHIIGYPLYDILPALITDFLLARWTELVMVNVGTNVGGTIIACRNTGARKNFILEDAFCYSGNTDQIHVCIKAANGTARMIKSKNCPAIPQENVNQIVNEYPKFQRINFLKLDTDGNDFDILEWGQESIIANRPTILRECDTFGTVHYVEKVLKSFQLLAKAGYSSVIVYDNFGNYFCNFVIEEDSLFLDALAYQIISQFGYCDLLFMAEKDREFISKEKNFFLDHVERSGMSPTFRLALKI